MVDLESISECWTLACRDAGYEPDSQATLYLVPGRPEGGSSALHIEPGSEVRANADWPLDRTQLQDANGAVRRNTHRIVVRDFSTARIALGRLRHELEHARQYDRCPDVYLAMSFVQSTIARAFGQLDLPCLDGSAALYNALPHEEDANRAAARLTEANFGPPSDDDLAGTDAPLFRNNVPIEEATLSRRLLATAALFPSAFEWVAQESGETVQDLLGRFGPDSEVAWSTLDDLPEMAGFGQRALDSSPTESEIRNATAPAAAWTPPREAIEVGREAAESALAEAMPNLSLN